MMKSVLVNQSISILKKGGVIIYPTDTIYGIGCDILSKKAVDRIYNLKKRDRSQTLILLVSDIDMLKKYITNIHPRIETLLSFHTRPLTIIYKANENVPAYLLGNRDTIGIRIVQHTFCQEIIRQLGRPITSTSANISGDSFPINKEEINQSLINNVDLMIPKLIIAESTDQPSVVARFDQEGELIILRN